MAACNCNSPTATQPQPNRNPTAPNRDPTATNRPQAYSSEYLRTYPGHSMAVYSVRWNRLHPSVFLSASVDWSLRIWDAQRAGGGAVMAFDLGDAVGDAAWAPYSATVAAAVTDDGRVHVFDLAVNRLAPLCSQKVRARRGLRGCFYFIRAARCGLEHWRTQGF